MVDKIVLGTIAEICVWVQVPSFSNMLYNKRFRTDYLKRHSFFKSYFPYFKLKAIINNKILPLHIRILARNILHSKSPIKSTTIKNKCLLTGRSRGIIKKLGISRMKLKTLADSGSILSLRKW